ncbi:hypothetical protein BU24DRAFT_278406 [Aaosphaeria arxii CBS 175.79]|uniref:Uncharacterized protein n=1 Tax=Aaosphaeria arxii CBS 175.79 TaxID=1450172 RepID=A0A6A5XEK4_9PLEO|nr:uncharacterized protein BU24DRAFT_278406 [Aaosphaeria arxii CBS 175.79]KAF2011309.1 hypothetical protein BU24DRAFT_278406 [Aaosphaeria arxii CBS 175.79]
MSSMSAPGPPTLSAPITTHDILKRRERSRPGPKKKSAAHQGAQVKPRPSQMEKYDPTFRAYQAVKMDRDQLLAVNQQLKSRMEKMELQSSHYFGIVSSMLSQLHHKCWMATLNSPDENHVSWLRTIEGAVVVNWRQSQKLVVPELDPFLSSLFDPQPSITPGAVQSVAAPVADAVPALVAGSVQGVVAGPSEGGNQWKESETRPHGSVAVPNTVQSVAVPVPDAVPALEAGSVQGAFAGPSEGGNQWMEDWRWPYGSAHVPNTGAFDTTVAQQLPEPSASMHGPTASMYGKLGDLTLSDHNLNVPFYGMNSQS